MRDVRVPARSGVRGEVGFVIEDFEGNPQTEFLEEQTKQLHLYVVRDDDEVFRHLHPTMAEDGAWTAPVTLPAGGDYRVIAEFVAEDEGGNGDHVILGTTGTVRGPADPVEDQDPTVRVEVETVARRRSRTAGWGWSSATPRTGRCGWTPTWAPGPT